jgi:energy-coupling factor transporter ATP-binding protein EcfA2
MKIRQAYPWQRFLVPRGGNISVDGLGLLRDPESAFGAHANPDLKTLAEIDHAPVVVLLGEPGIGKSTLLEHAAELAGRAEREVRRLDLAKYASEDRVSRRLSELTPVAKEVDTDLLIDSLDTGLLAIPTLAYVLAEAIRQHPPWPSVRLRIACRSADWPGFLEQALKDHWSATSVKVVEVAPLRRCDVACAARAEGLDDAGFIDELRSRRAGPFAARPLTLRFLLDSATAGQPLPATRAGLYRAGCERLAAEQSEPRRELKREGNRSPAERLAIAGRIAAVLTMTDRDAVWIGPRAEIDRVRDLSPDELIGELRFPDGSVDRASVDDINEVLSSGLFSLRQSGQLHFAHQTYREFLAAWHLDQQGLPAQRQLDLLCTPGERTLVPQLAEVAAWAAALDEDMFRGILSIHPPVLLTSDLAHRAPELRAELVDRILVLADQATWADTDWGLRDQYRSLAHAELPDQLRPWISGSERFLVARRIAIDIAEACKLSALSQPLLDVALSRDDAPAIRVQAIDALDKLADRSMKSQLLPLVETTADQDPSDSILAAALRALWPDLIDFRGLSPHLHPPREPSHLGGYWRFLNEDLAAGLSPREIPQALVWMRERLADEPPGDIDRVNDTMARSIVARAFRDIAQPGVAAELARFAVMFMELGRALFEGPIGRPDPSPLRDDQTRRRLLLALLPAIQRPQHAAALLSRGLHRGTALLLREDVPWLLDLADSSAYPTTTWTLARLLQEAYNPELAPGLANPILERCATNPVLKRALRLLWRPVSLSSRQAESARESRAFHNQLDQEHRQRMPDPPPAQRVETALERIEAGEPNAFIDLLRHLGWSSNGEYDYQEPLDPRELPGWCEAASADALAHRRCRLCLSPIQRSGVRAAHHHRQATT